MRSFLRRDDVIVMATSEYWKEQMKPYLISLLSSDILLTAFCAVESQFCNFYAVYEALHFVQIYVGKCLKRAQIKYWDFYDCLMKATTFTTGLRCWPCVIRYYCIMIYVQLFFWRQISLNCYMKLFWARQIWLNCFTKLICLGPRRVLWTQHNVLSHISIANRNHLFLFLPLPFSSVYCTTIARYGQFNINKLRNLFTKSQCDSISTQPTAVSCYWKYEVLIVI